MNSMIFNPLKEYKESFKDLHLNNTREYFDNLVSTSGINVEENQKTVKEYERAKESSKKLKSKLNWLRFFRVLMIITLILIPLVIIKITPKIKDLRSKISEIEQTVISLYNRAVTQMAPLNALFSDRDCLKLIEKTIPQISFDEYFSEKRQMDMKINFDLDVQIDCSRSTMDVLSGTYNENPFVFENTLCHTMGTHVYHGYRTISWVEYYTDSNGRRQRRVRTQTLHAQVIRPMPYYTNQITLKYGAQGGPELCFSRDATNLDDKSEREIEKHVKKGEKALKKKTDDAIKNNSNFTSMSNTEFEVLFDALDRNNEVQFRTLFTPLAQTNMVELLLSKDGYGDDFNFYKRNRMNTIISSHSQGRNVVLSARNYDSYSFDQIKDNFINKNARFFKDLYFDFAPILAIPIYQERPVHSLNPIPDYSQKYSSLECEALANDMDYRLVVHPNTKSRAILKSEFVCSKDGADVNKITAYSYDILPRVEFIPVLGGDGRFHNVAVPWDEYIPLVAQTDFSVSKISDATDKNILAKRNGLCIYSLN